MWSCVWLGGSSCTFSSEHRAFPVSRLEGKCSSGKHKPREEWLNHTQGRAGRFGEETRELASEKIGLSQEQNTLQVHVGVVLGVVHLHGQSTQSIYTRLLVL